MSELKKIIESDELLEIGRKAVEDTLIDFRDSRLSQLLRGNGLVIKEKDGTASDIIRLGMEQALKISLKAIVEHLEKEKRDLTDLSKS